MAHAASSAHRCIRVSITSFEPGTAYRAHLVGAGRDDDKAGAATPRARLEVHCRHRLRGAVVVAQLVSLGGAREEVVPPASRRLGRRGAQLRKARLQGVCVGDGVDVDNADVAQQDADVFVLQRRALATGPVVARPRPRARGVRVRRALLAEGRRHQHVAAVVQLQPLLEPAPRLLALARPRPMRPRQKARHRGCGERC